jgi:hypothetical protein
MHLRFDPDQSNDFEIRDPGNSVVEQCGLAHAGVASQDERAADPTANTGKEPSDFSLFVLTAHEPSRRCEAETHSAHEGELAISTAASSSEVSNSDNRERSPWQGCGA